MSRMAVPKVRVEMTEEEIRALISLAEDLLFRVKFIDPKMPGHQGNPAIVRAAESAIHLLKAATSAGSSLKRPGPSSKRPSPSSQVRIKKLS